MKQLRMFERDDLASEHQRSANDVHPDLSNDLLSECLFDGVRRSRDASPLNPANVPGVDLQGEFLASLTERLTPKGWRREQRGGIDLLISGDSAVSLQILTGGRGVGLYEEKPSSKNRRGKCSVEIFEKNTETQQLNLFDNAKRKHWVVLFRIQEEGCFCELVLPVGVLADGKTFNVARRVVLPPIQLDTELPVVQSAHSSAQDVPEDIVIEVRPKA